VGCRHTLPRQLAHSAAGLHPPLGTVSHCLWGPTDNIAQVSMTFIHGVLSVFSLVLFASDSAFAAGSRENKLVETGREIAQSHCARCHGISRIDESPLEQAPPFRRLHERYPIEQLAEALAEGIVVGHMEMPAFQFEPREIEALLAYLGTLERGKRKGN